MVGMARTAHSRRASAANGGPRNAIGHAPPRRHCSIRQRIGVAGAVLLVCGTWGDAQVPTRSVGNGDATAYTVVCPEGATEAGTCAVDRLTFVGWQVFHRTCDVCHAADAVGSSFAPNLLLRIRGMDSRGFRTAMDFGYTGEADMSPWGRNPDVRPYYVELWTYLSARAAGDLPRGEPQPMPARAP